MWIVRSLQTSLVTLALAGLLRPPWPALAAPPGIGEPAPAFTVPTLDGTSFDLAAHQGRVVVVMFTAPGCGECIPELRNLSQINAEYAGRGVDIVALNIDSYTTDDDLRDFKSFVGGADYIWAQDQGGLVTRAYGVRALETTVIIDRSGQIAYRDETTTSVDAYRAALEPLL